MLQSARTACPEDSIWISVHESTFRKHIHGLLSKSEQPVQAGVNLPDLAIVQCQANTGVAGHARSRLLSLDLEKSLATDFAFLAATKEGARSVTACCVEENTIDAGSALVIRLAGNNGVPQKVVSGLRDVCQLLQQRRTSVTANHARETLLATIVRLDLPRIMARINRALGGRPSHRGGGRDPNASTLDEVATKMKNESSQPLVDDFLSGLKGLKEYLMVAKSAHTGTKTRTTGESYQAIVNLIKACYECCTGGGRLPLKERLAEIDLALMDWANHKLISQIDKLGAYWRIARTFVEQFRRDGPLRQFASVVVERTDAYYPVTNDVANNGRAVKSHVHVEVQMAIHYLLTRNNGVHQPRFIGVSKDACFLCFLFLACYGRFEVPRTHGHLHDQWTIPDLQRYNKAQRALLRRTISAMDQTILSLSRKDLPCRPFALQSRHNVEVLPLQSAQTSIRSLDALLEVAQHQSTEIRKHEGSSPSFSSQTSNFAAESRALVDVQEDDDISEAVHSNADAKDDGSIAVASVAGNKSFLVVEPPSPRESLATSSRAVRSVKVIGTSTNVGVQSASLHSATSTREDPSLCSSLEQVFFAVPTDSPLSRGGHLHPQSQSQDLSESFQEVSSAVSAIFQMSPGGPPHPQSSWLQVQPSDGLRLLPVLSPALRLYVELESPSRGRARIIDSLEEATDEQNTTSIDLDGLRSGHEVTVSCTEESQRLILDLHKQDEKLCSLELEWAE